MIRCKLHIILLTILVTSSIEAMSQTDMILTQHWNMPTLLNPASTGDTEFIRLRGGARLQYLGASQSPKDFVGTVDAPFKISNERLGAGLFVNNNTYHLFDNLLIGIQGSYQFKIKRNNLRIGIGLGYYHSKFKGSELKTEEDTEGQKTDSGIDDTEGNFPLTDVSGGKFDVSVGIKYILPYFQLGLSALHLTNSTVRMEDSFETTEDYRQVESKLPATFYLDLSGNIPLKNTLFTIHPSIVLGTDFHNFVGVGELRFTYKQKITFGADYRWKRAAGIVVGYYLKDFYIGYSWEYDYKDPIKGSTGNHELVLGYQFKINMEGKKRFSHRSIRLM